jgi:hypothetical protein
MKSWHDRSLDEILAALATDPAPLLALEFRKIMIRSSAQPELPNEARRAFAR